MQINYRREEKVLRNLRGDAAVVSASACLFIFRSMSVKVCIAIDSHTKQLESTKSQHPTLIRPPTF
jgi:hypothetical protein